VDRTDSGSCSMVSSGINGVEPLGSTTRVSVSQSVTQLVEWFKL